MACKTSIVATSILASTLILFPVSVLAQSASAAAPQINTRDLERGIMQMSKNIELVSRLIGAAGPGVSRALGDSALHLNRAMESARPELANAARVLETQMGNTNLPRQNEAPKELNGQNLTQGLQMMAAIMGQMSVAIDKSAPSLGRAYDKASPELRQSIDAARPGLNQAMEAAKPILRELETQSRQQIK